MPTPEGNITGSQIWQSPIEPAPAETVEETTEEVKEEVEEATE